MLIALSDRADIEGGATRLFPTGKYDDSAVDVLLPRGYPLVFEQTLLHTGLAVARGTKYILQTGAAQSGANRRQGGPCVTLRSNSRRRWPTSRPGSALGLMYFTETVDHPIGIAICYRN